MIGSVRFLSIILKESRGKGLGINKLLVRARRIKESEYQS